jgi:protein-S-isoprenylcysteine O-methyltransferase Ste14
MPLLNQLFSSYFSGARPFSILTAFVVSLCVVTILISILINFTEARTDSAEKEKRSIVATNTMIGFFIALFLILRFRVGTYSIHPMVQDVLTVFGLIILILGAIVNIKGRFALGSNWSDHIKMYQGHTLVTQGVYRFVRHPLYASLIWMFYASGVIYHNYGAMLATTFIFMPFMHYRAGQEEKLLTERFPEYNDYVKSVGRFFPRLFHK